MQRALQMNESMPDHAWSADAAGRLTYVNAVAFLGHAREDLNSSEDEDGFGWGLVAHPDDHDRVAARWRHCLETGYHYDSEHRLRRADGVYRCVNSGRPSRHRQGRITEWHGTTVDIEEQKQAQAALHDAELELSQLVNMVPSHPDIDDKCYTKRCSQTLLPGRSSR
jgi:PAS domain S-box-containing protein